MNTFYDHLSQGSYKGRCAESITMETEVRLFSYVVAVDSGFAPNPEGKFCTLGCCKPRLRKAAREKDWIVGLGPSDLGSAKICFAMVVAEICSFDEYYKEDRFKNRRDNIYRRSPSKQFEQLKNPYHGPEALSHDTKVDRVLIASQYWYFGKDLKSVPPELTATGMFTSSRDYRKTADINVVSNLGSWLKTTFSEGILGESRCGSQWQKRIQIGHMPK